LVLLRLACRWARRHAEARACHRFPLKTERGRGHISVCAGWLVMVLWGARTIYRMLASLLLL
jgi:hypothetical protein